MKHSVFLTSFQLLIEFILNLTIASNYESLCSGMAPEGAQDRNRPKVEAQELLGQPSLRLGRGYAGLRFNSCTACSPFSQCASIPLAAAKSEPTTTPR